jgi:hypothetical protein
VKVTNVAKDLHGRLKRVEANQLSTLTRLDAMQDMVDGLESEKASLAREVESVKINRTVSSLLYDSGMR